MSKIIRNSLQPQEVFTLEPLGVFQATAQEVFRAVQLGGDEPAEVAEEEQEAPPCIPEEEALRRIQQAQADGLKAGRQQAEADLATVSEALAQALLATGSLRAQILHEAEEDLLKLSVLIARKVMLRELTLDPRILSGLVRAAVELASDEGEIVVRLNPEDHEVVVFCPEIKALTQDKKRVLLKGDPALARAGCVVETVRGNIDAGVEAQLDEIFRRLTEERSARREDKEGA